MGNSWSGLRKKLEQDLLCESLRGRVQYFATHYHGAPDNYGRFCIRVDGKEYVMANPYTEGKAYRLEQQLKEERNIPPREYDGKGGFLNDEVNRQVEDEAGRILANQGYYDMWYISDTLEEYTSASIQDSLSSENPVVRCLAVMDRRVGKRTLRKLAETVDAQPEWVQFFYRLRLDAEKIV